MSDIPHVRIKSDGPQGRNFTVTDSETGKMRTDIVGFTLKASADRLATIVHLETVAVVDELDVGAVIER